MSHCTQSIVYMDICIVSALCINKRNGVLRTTRCSLTLPVTARPIAIDPFYLIKQWMSPQRHFVTQFIPAVWPISAARYASIAHDSWTVVCLLHSLSPSLTRHLLIVPLPTRMTTLLFFSSLFASFLNFLIKALVPALSLESCCCFVLSHVNWIIGRHLI